MDIDVWNADMNLLVKLPFRLKKTLCGSSLNSFYHFISSSSRHAARCDELDLTDIGWSEHCRLLPSCQFRVCGIAHCKQPHRSLAIGIMSCCCHLLHLLTASYGRLIAHHTFTVYIVPGLSYCTRSIRTWMQRWLVKDLLFLSKLKSDDNVLHF